MYFTKKQLQIIAHSVSLLESDGDNNFTPGTNHEMHQILAKLQESNIWGNEQDW